MSSSKKSLNKGKDQSIENLPMEFSESSKVKLKLSGKDLLFDEGKWIIGNIIIHLFITDGIKNKNKKLLNSIMYNVYSEWY